MEHANPLKLIYVEQQQNATPHESFSQWEERNSAFIKFKRGEERRGGGEEGRSRGEEEM